MQIVEDIVVSLEAITICCDNQLQPTLLVKSIAIY
jgi:hypothetical protein